MTPTPRGARAALLFPILVLVAATVACSSQAPASSAAPASSSSSSSSSGGAAAPSATPTPTPATLVQAFGGKCESVLTDAAVSADLSAPVVLFTAKEWGPSDYATASLGGVNCYWNEPKTSDDQFLDLIVVPSAAVSSPVTKPLDCSTDGGFSQCYFNAFDSGYWFSGRATGKAGATLASLKADTAKIEAQLAPAAASAGAPPTATVFPGSGPSQPAARRSARRRVSSRHPVPRRSSRPSSTASPTVQTATTPCSTPPRTSAAPGRPTARSPPGKLAGFTVELAPGGSWAKPLAVTSKFVAVTVPGADSAFTESDSQGVEYLEVFKGSNWAAFEPYGNGMTLAQIAPVATAVLGALG